MRICISIVVAVSFIDVSQAAPPSPSQRAELAEPIIDFDRQIRPILSDACFQCHGPDQEQRQTELRLDVRASAFGDLDDYQAIVPGHPDQSELYRRITSTDQEKRMPPASAGHRLSQQQVELIERWIRQGAVWKEHWAFMPPQRPRLPQISTPSQAHIPVDHFILDRLAEEGLSLSKHADKRTLLRRLTLDLTGLPPTPAEVSAFLADKAPGAYERQVDRLLASPSFGERMALPWLDAARYADTSGYQNDGPRYMWRWRDWVIDAINQNMPFDQFTIEQLAGDLLPAATMQQRIATGFNRNHRGNAEGGIIPEEYAVEYVVDRVETTGTVWLGLTIGCARCHDHKFDPISQHEFYQLFAFFNNVPESGRAIKEGNSPPFIKAPTPRQLAGLQQLNDELEAARLRFAQSQAELSQAQTRWERSVEKDLAGAAWTLSRNLVARFPFDRNAAAGEQATIETWECQKGVVGGAAAFDGVSFYDAGDVADFGYFDEFSISAWIRPSSVASESQRSLVSRMADAKKGTGYAITLADRRIHVNLVKRWLDDAIRVHTRQRIDGDTWTHVTVTYDGSRRASGIQVYLDGVLAALEVEVDLLNQSFHTPEPLRIGGGGGSDAAFHGLIDDVHIYDRPLSPEEALLLATADNVTEILSTVLDERTVGQRKKLRAYFLDRYAPNEIQRLYQQMIELQAHREDFWRAVPTVMVMQEATKPSKTFVLQRGRYDQPTDEVLAGTPSCLPPLPDSPHTDRLALARWIVGPSNPLTARVAVNRYWQILFGTGLVDTPEDFGSQGARPSHPRLLDWLATEFVSAGWDVKSIVRTIVTSSTYRQSSYASDELLQRDPNNRLLARGPRFRLRAELIRDQALAASGLLVPRIGGPSVRPRQPEGLWKEIASDTDYHQSTGEGLYRRSLYTYWKRTVAPPSMMTFDASARETCTVRTTRTNTPLQALTLMNDVVYVEASRVLGQHLMLVPGLSPKQRLERAFQTILGRAARPKELDVLVDSFRWHLGYYRSHPALAPELVRVGDQSESFAVQEDETTLELAAYTMAISLVFNLDEAMTKE